MDRLRPFSVTTMCSVLLAILLLLAVPVDRSPTAATPDSEESATEESGRNQVTDNMILKTFRQLAGEHISLSMLYLGYASHFDRSDIALPGFRDYFLELSRKEQAMGLQLMAYVSKRGGYMYFPKQMKLKDWCARLNRQHRDNPLHQQWKSFKHHTHRAGCICHEVLNHKRCQNVRTSAQALQAMLDVYYVESYMLTTLQNLHGKAAIDPVGRHLVEDEFLVKRVDAIKAVVSTITELFRFKAEKKYSTGEYLIDEEIGKKSPE